MRSSVSVILSDPPPDAAMSFPDYQQTALDHQSLLIVVKQVGQHLKTRTFNKLYDRICRLQHVWARDSLGNRRSVWVRYRRSYPTENNDWGEFQTHRRVLALLTIGQVGSQSDLNEVCGQHESLRGRYSSTLLDSRCVVLGVDPCGRPAGSASAPLSCAAPPHSPSASSVSSGAPSAVSSQQSQSLPKKKKPVSAGGSLDRDSGVYDNSEHGHSSMSEANSGHSSDSDESEDTAGSVMHNAVLDRSGKSAVSSSCPTTPPPPLAPPAADDPMPAAPPDEGVGGQQLRPPAGFRSQALFHAGAEDASCLQLEEQLQELYCSLFWVLEARRLDRAAERCDRPQLLCAPFERKDFVGLDMDSRSNKRRCQGRVKKHLGDVALQTGMATEAIAHYTAASELLRQSNDWLWLAGCFEGMCSASAVVLYPELRRTQIHRNASLNQTRVNRTGRPTPTAGSHSLPHGVDPAEFLEACKLCLTPAELVDKYREAVVHYSKYRHAGVIETECSLKAVHVLIEQGRYLMAAEFLQNVVFINLQLSDEEKIQRFTTLSDLYEQCGFERKAAFFRRVAAMRYVASQNPQPSWQLCYQLLQQTLHGYRLSLDSTHLLADGVPGWPALQTQILQELVGSARRMGNTPLAVRHLTQLLQTMFWSLRPLERSEFALQLETLAAQCPAAATPQPLALPSGLIVPAVQLHTLPVVRRFRPLAYPPHLNPLPLRVPEPDQSGPFIFSPFQFTSLVRNEKADKLKEEFAWVEGELSQVEVAVENLLSADLRVTGVCLLTECTDGASSAAMDQYPSCLSLAAHSGLHLVNLVGAPRTAGQVTVTGYTATVLGTRSTCRLRHILWIPAEQFCIDVVPALPLIQVSTTASRLPGNCPFDAAGLVQGASLSLYNGETTDMTVTLKNASSSQPVQLLELALEPASLQHMFHFSVDHVTSQLPLEPGACATLSVRVAAQGEFTLAADPDDSVSVSGGSLLSSTLASLPSRFSCSATASHRLADNLSSLSIGGAAGIGGSSVHSSTDSGRNTPRPSLHPSNHQHSKCHPAKSVEAVLRVRYSGGAGMEAGYCRSFGIIFSLEILPSVFLTKWDVMPAESPGWCYLVLDMLNGCDQELELQYTDSKCIQIESRETCRIPVPVQRCPLSPNKSETDCSAVSEHVNSAVKLCWSMSDLQRRGSASLASVYWSPAMLDTLRMAPLLWDVRLDGASVDSQQCAVPCSVGRPCSLSVCVTSRQAEPLHAVQLLMRPFQDLCNGTLSHRLDSKLAVSGATRVTAQTMSYGDELRHSATLLFFTPGQYKVALRLTAGGDDCHGQVVAPPSDSWSFVATLDVVL